MIWETPTVLQGITILLFVWLVIFAVAWITPYAWRGIGLVLGTGWGLAPLLMEAIRRWWNDVDLLVFLASVFSSPFTDRKSVV